MESAAAPVAVSISLRRIALLSPDAPDWSHPAASHEADGASRTGSGEARHFHQGHERHFIFRGSPRKLSDANGLALPRVVGSLSVNDETVSLQCRHIGERVAELNMPAERPPGLSLRRLCQADAPAEETGGR